MFSTAGSSLATVGMLSSRRFRQVFNHADRRRSVELISHAAPTMGAGKEGGGQGGEVHDLGQRYRQAVQSQPQAPNPVIVSPRSRTMRRAHHSKGRTIKTIDAQ